MTSAVRGTRLIVVAVIAVLALVSGCAGQPGRVAATPSRSAASARPVTPTPAPATATAAPVGGDGSYRTAERQVTFTEPAHTGAVVRVVVGGALGLAFTYGIGHLFGTAIH